MRASRRSPQVPMEQLSLFPAPAYHETASGFVYSIVRFEEFGRRTMTEVADGITYHVNEFWTSGQRRSHSIHEISYRACFKAQLPAFFITRLTRPDEAVHDPFMGRGTTLVEAALTGRRCCGNDINPLSVFLTRPRLRPIRLADVAESLRTIDWQRGDIGKAELLAFYHPATLRQLEALRLWLGERAPPGGDMPDPVTDWIRMVALNRLSGHSPGFFSGRSMPPNQAVSIKAQHSINRRLGISPPEKDVAGLILRKTRSLLRNGQVSSPAISQLFTGPAWDTPCIEDASIDLVVTSPPFLDVVQYAADNWLRCWFADIDPDEVELSMHGSVEAWTAMVASVLAEQARIVRPGGWVAFEVGEVRRGRVLLEKLVWQAAGQLPFRRVGVMVNDQEFTKTANCWGVANRSKGTNTNRIVLLHRQ